MSSILIDGAAADIQFAESANVSQVFELVRDAVWESGRIVVEVRIDGETVVWGDGAAVWLEPFDPSHLMEIQTAIALDLSLSVLQEIGSRCPGFAEAHRTAARLLREDDHQGGIEQTDKILPTWKDIHEGVRQVCLLHGIDYSKREWADVAALLTPTFQAVLTQLHDLSESIEAQDIVLTADLLEYELAPLAEQWQELCFKLGQILRGRFSTEGE